MEKFWTDTASAVLAGIIAPGILGGLALAIPPIRKWLADQRHIWQVAFITALLTAIMSSVVISLFLGSGTIVATAQRIGFNGIEGRTRDNKPVEPFSQTHDFQPIPEADPSQICTLSNIYTAASYSPGSCELHRELYPEGYKWAIQVKGGLSCRVACFKLEVQR